MVLTVFFSGAKYNLPHLSSLLFAASLKEMLLSVKQFNLGDVLHRRRRSVEYNRSKILTLVSCMNCNLYQVQFEKCFLTYLIVYVLLIYSELFACSMGLNTRLENTVVIRFIILGDERLFGAESCQGNPLLPEAVWRVFCTSKFVENAFYLI